MKNYRQLLKELPSKSVVFAFGRFNPPTIGHELLLKVVQKLAKTNKADHIVYASRTHDKKKNPLSIDRKLHYLKLMFKGVNFAAANDDQRTFIEVAKALNKKYKNIIMVAGSDRVPEFKNLLTKYNKDIFNFDTIQVVSAGERDPDADDATGISASKMRTLASKGNYKEFKKGLPNSVREIDGKLLMNEIRQGMGLDTIKEEVNIKTDALREQYFKGEIFHIGDIVESAGKQYEIMDRGSNYVTVVDVSGDLHRKWIKDVKLVNIKTFEAFISEDIQPGPAPKEITFKGYTTQNLHHSADAAKAFQDTITRSENGLVQYDPVAILNALKATDTYMKLNDMHLEQGKAPDQIEVDQWIAAHDKAKEALENIGEFPHHLSYWNAHKTELQLMTAKKPDLEEALSIKTLRPAQDKLKVARVLADMLGVNDPEKSSSPEQLVNAGLRNLRKQQINKSLVHVVQKMLDLASNVGIKYDTHLTPQALKNVKEDKDNQITPDNTDYNLANGILKYSDFNKLKKLNAMGKGKNVKISEADEVQVLPISAAAPELKVPTTSVHPDSHTGHTLSPQKDAQIRRRKVKYMSETTLNKNDPKGDYEAKSKALYDLSLNKGVDQAVVKQRKLDLDKEYAKEQLEEGVFKATVSYKQWLKDRGEKHTPQNTEKYKQDMELPTKDKQPKKQQTESDIVVGKQYRVGDDSGKLNSISKRAMFGTMWEEHKEDHEDEEELSDKELDKMVDGVTDEEIIDHAYDDEDWHLVDGETGEHVEELKEDIQAINEILSRTERIRQKIRFSRTKAKRQRRTAIALKKYSSAPVINRRARKLAIKLLKQRLARKPVGKLTVGEKERVERMLQKRKALVNRLAMRLVPRIKRVEQGRISGHKYKPGKSNLGF